VSAYPSAGELAQDRGQPGHRDAVEILGQREAAKKCSAHGCFRSPENRFVDGRVGLGEGAGGGDGRARLPLGQVLQRALCLTDNRVEEACVCGVGKLGGPAQHHGSDRPGAQGVVLVLALEVYVILIVRDLITGPKRFETLQRAGINPRTLSARLRHLVR